MPLGHLKTPGRMEVPNAKVGPAMWGWGFGVHKGWASPLGLPGTPQSRQGAAAGGSALHGLLGRELGACCALLQRQPSVGAHPVALGDEGRVLLGLPCAAMG